MLLDCSYPTPEHEYRVKDPITDTLSVDADNIL